MDGLCTLQLLNLSENRQVEGTWPAPGSTGNPCRCSPGISIALTSGHAVIFSFQALVLSCIEFWPSSAVIFGGCQAALDLCSVSGRELLLLEVYTWFLETLCPLVEEFEGFGEADGLLALICVCRLPKESLCSCSEITFNDDYVFFCFILCNLDVVNLGCEFIAG